MPHRAGRPLRPWWQAWDPGTVGPPVTPACFSGARKPGCHGRIRTGIISAGLSQADIPAWMRPVLWDFPWHQKETVPVYSNLHASEDSGIYTGRRKTSLGILAGTLPWQTFCRLPDRLYLVWQSRFWWYDTAVHAAISWW